MIRHVMTDPGILDSMIETIVHDFQPESVILFGSRARDDANLSSDFDFLVVFHEVVDKRKMAIDIRRALNRYAISKDIIVTTMNELQLRSKVVGTIYRSVVQYGKVLYERK